MYAYMCVCMKVWQPYTDVLDFCVQSDIRHLTLLYSVRQSWSGLETIKLLFEVVELYYKYVTPEKQMKC